MIATKDAVIDRMNSEDAIARAWAAYARKAEAKNMPDDEVLAAFDAYVSACEAGAAGGAE